MTANTHPDTGIRYGVISGNSLDGDLLSEMMINGDNLSYNEWRADKAKEIKAEIENGIYGEVDPDDVESEVERLLEDASENWEGDECTYEGEMDGVKWRISWLGGAPLVWALEGKVGYATKLCSPCVPNAADLDSGFISEEDVANDNGELTDVKARVDAMFSGGKPMEVGFHCYVVPRKWLREES